MTKVFACILCIVVVSGCASASVNRGALIGAASGLVVGAGVGFAVSDPDLLGTPKGKDTLALKRGDSILAGLAIGVVTGAIVGAMVGHRRDEPYEMPPKPAAAPASSGGEAPTTTAERDARQQAERAPYVREARGL